MEKMIALERLGETWKKSNFIEQKISLRFLLSKIKHLKKENVFLLTENWFPQAGIKTFWRTSENW